MREQRQIVQLWRRGGARVLVTLVQVEGSSYRRPGARMLLAEDGSYTGMISGGCLEAEVIRRASWMVREGAVVERYSTAFDEGSDAPFGLGCGGTVDLLLEPADAPEGSALLQCMERALAGESFKVITWLPGEGHRLRRIVLDKAGAIVFASEGLSQKKVACSQALAPGEDYAGRFVEQLHPAQRLVIFGAGDDAKPLAAMASLIGWIVIVADGRSQLATVARFPSADRVLVASDADTVAQLGITANDAVAVMSHSYEQDRSLLTALLPLQPKYLGLLGAKHRSSLLVSEASQASGLSIAECCKRLWAPIGLDLGGDGPEAIALAIMAEIQSVCTNRAGTSRRLLPEDVMRHLGEKLSCEQLASQCKLDAAS